MTEKDEQFWAEIEKLSKQKVIKPKTCFECRKVLNGRYFEVQESGEIFCPECVEQEGYDI